MGGLAVCPVPGGLERDSVQDNTAESRPVALRVASVKSCCRYQCERGPQDKRSAVINMQLGSKP
jgi:hypothetical protein